jgi:polyribonucleotide nucleotidyltransferase
MGMLIGDKGRVSDEDAIILSDISGTDALGTIYFKVAGDREGITTSSSISSAKV